jgi:hypothetical protein
MMSPIALAVQTYLEQRHKTLIQDFYSKEPERPIALAVPDTFPAYEVDGSYCLGLPLRRAAITEPAFIWRNQETEKLSHTRLRHLDPQPARPRVVTCA